MPLCTRGVTVDTPPWLGPWCGLVLAGSKLVFQIELNQETTPGACQPGPVLLNHQAHFARWHALVGSFCNVFTDH